MKPFNTNHTFKDIPCIFYPPWWLEELLPQRRHKCPWRSPDSPSTPEQPPLRSSLQCHRRCILILEKRSLSLSWSIIFSLWWVTLLWCEVRRWPAERRSRRERDAMRAGGQEGTDCVYLTSTRQLARVLCGVVEKVYKYHSEYINTNIPHTDVNIWHCRGSGLSFVDKN